MRDRFPEVFARERVLAPEVSPPRPGAGNSASAKSTPVIVGAENSPTANPPVVTVDSSPPVNVSGTADALEKQRKGTRDWNNVTDSNDRGNDEDWNWGNHIRPAAEWEYIAWDQTNTRWAPAHTWAPDDADPPSRGEENRTESPPQTSPHPPGNSAHSEPRSTEPPGVASITAQETLRTVRTRSIRPKIPGTGQDSTESMSALQTLAMRGAPIGRQDRLNRQHLACTLRLPPEIYNCLVSGEQEADSAAITDPSASAALPPPLRLMVIDERGDKIPRPLFAVVNIAGDV